uniref:Integrin alpha FG GAP repeat containing protein n=1 Tax=Echinococcus granulosus TaxID=6210 RepID=A0A068WD30_ECHGR|nr:integrin alpha FG GAP repeat containing protein [Echinococcus granulosus]
MRNISFIDRVEVPGVTTTTSTNLYLYDVDDDGDIELIIGHWDLGDLDPSVDSICPNGSLLILKYGRIWKSCRDLNMVTCVTAGRLCSKEKPSVVALCADSQCYIFDATSKARNTASSLSLVCNQQIACNAKDACVLEGGMLSLPHLYLLEDGPCDMAVAYSDRIVRLFHWVPGKPSEGRTGKLVLLIKWELAGQISRISLHSTPSMSNLILASQPGGGFAFLQKKFESYEDRMCPTLVYHPPKHTSDQNIETRTWIVGGLKCNLSVAADYLIGLCLADGTVHLLSADLQKSKTIWSVSLPSDGSDELAVCCWDGSTFIFNHEKDILHFPVGQACQAFTAGRLAISPGRNEPVLIYATCEQSVLIYYNLDVQSIPSCSLLHALATQPDVLERLQRFSNASSDPGMLRKSIHYLLYELPCHPNGLNLP